MRPLPERIAHLLLRRRTISEDTGCWEWTGSRNPAGYGVVHISAHRLAAILWSGLDPLEQHNVCHHCDNPACFNPEHLYLGSPVENARDRTRRGRGRENNQRGRDNPHAKLTEEQVREIVRLVVEEGLSQERAGARFGVGQAHVWRLITGRAWGHLTNLPGRPPEGTPRKKRTPETWLRGETHPSSTMTEDKVRELRALAASGVSQTTLARHFGISNAQTSFIVRRHRWAHVPDMTPDEAAAARQTWDAQHTQT